MTNRFETAPDAIRYATAGKARITLVSPKTGARFTYRISVKGEVKFVSVLTGSDNDSDFTYLGTIFADGAYRHGRKSSIGPEAPSTKAFAWAWGALAAGVMPTCEIWHEGRCGRCGRSLTVPESIASGLGPECASK